MQHPGGRADEARSGPGTQRVPGDPTGSGEDGRHRQALSDEMPGGHGLCGGGRMLLHRVRDRVPKISGGPCGEAGGPAAGDAAGHRHELHAIRQVRTIDTTGTAGSGHGAAGGRAGGAGGPKTDRPAEKGAGDRHRRGHRRAYRAGKAEGAEGRGVHLPRAHDPQRHVRDGGGGRARRPGSGTAVGGVGGRAP